MAADFTPLHFTEAIDFYRQKIRLPSESWTDIWQEHHAHAFVVAGANTDALVEDLYNAVDQAKTKGGYAEFQKAFPQIAEKHGWAFNGSPGWRSKIIYDTNVTQAYNAGRYQQMASIKHLRPYWRYRHHTIENPRLSHKAWDGLILSADDPWWDSHYPQNGWNCKCTVDALTRTAAEREWTAAGKSGPDAAPPMEWEERVVGKTGPHPRTVLTPKGIDPGFAYNPGKAWLEPHIVPPLPDHLAHLVPDEWPWPKGYKPPAIRPPTLAHSYELVDEARAATPVIAGFLDTFGATLTEPAVLTDVSGSALVIGSRMFIPGGAPYDPALGDEQFKMVMEGKQGRKKYMNLLAKTLVDPDEIWESWETFEKGENAGKKFVSRHYLKSFEIVDQGNKKRYAIIVFRRSRYGWEWDGITTFHSSGDNYFNKRRRGFLRYKK
ncbi:MAG: hypothetical protein LBE62_12900 [Azonexus sp.]|nr:hypothetical protein [Azonexus sp.]